MSYDKKTKNIDGGDDVATIQAPKPKAKIKEALKDKVYVLKSEETPLLYFLNNRHTEYNDLQYFDEETQTLRALRYCTNQRSVFEDEQTGNVVLGQIQFENGKLIVPKSNPTLQKFLELTPANGIKFYEFDPEEIAILEIDKLDLEFDAQSTARGLSIDKLEDIALSIPTIGNKALKMNSTELKRDVLLYAKHEPLNFLNLATNEDTTLSGSVVWALDNGVLTFRNYKFYNGADLLLEVPFDEPNPNMMVVRYLKTKEGNALLKYIESKRK